MALLRNFVFFALVLCAVAFNTDAIVREIHSFKPPFLQDSSSIPYWDFGGSTVVHDDKIQLTPEANDRMGFVWNGVPVDMEEWEVTVRFKIHGRSHIGADGMAFWYTRDRMQMGRVFGSKDQFVGLGVFFDTYDNNGFGDHPYILAMLNDGTKTYDHDNDGLAHQLDGCKAALRNTRGVVTARIKYEGQRLTVDYDVVDSGLMQHCIDVNNIVLPRGFYFGVSGMTGGYYDNHEVFSVTAMELGDSSLHAEPEKVEEKEEVDPMFIHTKEENDTIQKLHDIAIGMKERLFGTEQVVPDHNEHEIFTEPMAKGTAAHGQLAEQIAVLHDELHEMKADMDKALALIAVGVDELEAHVGEIMAAMELHRTDTLLEVMKMELDGIAASLGHKTVGVDRTVQGLASDVEKLRESMEHATRNQAIAAEKTMTTQEELAGRMGSGRVGAILVMMALFQVVLIAAVVLYRRLSAETRKML